MVFVNKEVIIENVIQYINLNSSLKAILEPFPTNIHQEKEPIKRKVQLQSMLCQIDHKLDTKTESEYVHLTLRFTFLNKFASMFQHN